MPGPFDVPLHFVETLDEALAFKRWLGQRRDVLAVDTETGGFDWWTLKVPRLVQVGDASAGWSIPWEGWGGIVRELLPVYNDSPVAFHNGKFDLHFLGPNGCAPQEYLVDDTMLMAYVLDASSPVGLKPLAARLIHPQATAGEHLLKDAMKKGGWDWATVPIDLPEYWIYAALDTVLTARMHGILKPQLHDAQAECYETEIRVLHLLRRAEERGFRIDRAYCTAKLDELYPRIEALEDEMRARYDVHQMTANRAVAEALERDGVFLPVRTKTGAAKLDDAILDHVDHPLADAVRKHRDWTRVANTYFKNFLELSGDDGILHCDVRQIGAKRTGRMSVSRPALQTIPRTKLVRSAFIPSDGNRLVLCDYSQMEFRAIGAYSGEPLLIDAAKNGLDLHQVVADMVGCTRQDAKGINYGLGYGAGEEKIAILTGRSLAEVRVFLSNYWNRFSRVRPFMQSVIRSVRSRGAGTGIGYVETIVGRRPQIQVDRAYAAINYLVQGGCADIVKRKLVDLDNMGLGDTFVLPVHDEAIFDVPTEDAEEAKVLAEETMFFDMFGTPLDAEGSVCENWGTKYA